MFILIAIFCVLALLTNSMVKGTRDYNYLMLRAKS